VRQRGPVQQRRGVAGFDQQRIVRLGAQAVGGVGQ